MARKEPKPSIKNILYGLSGNKCGNPKCKSLIIKDGVTLGEICHIEAAEEKGPRYNKNSNDEYRRSLENLILLCRECHKIIDTKVEDYPVELIYEWKQKQNNTEITLPYFYSSETLQAKDILGPRSFLENGYREDIYIKRELDKNLKKSIENKRNVLIIGKSLSGKSRAIYNYLKNEINSDMIFVINKKVNKKDIQNLIAYRKENTKGNIYIVINDIDQYIKLDFFDDLLERLLELTKRVILSTCKKIRLNHLYEKFDNHALYFDDLHVESLNNIEHETVLKEVGTLNPTLIPDDTIGSYFFPLKHMEVRYSKIKNQKKLEYHILKTYKCFYLFRHDITDKINDNNQNQDINSKKFTDYFIEYLDKYLGKYQGEEITLGVFNNSKDELITLGFITEEEEDGKFYIEDAYLERIILFQEITLAYELIKLYPKGEIYGPVIFNLSDDKKALDLLEEYNSRNDIQEKNNFPFNAYMARFHSYDSIFQVFKKMFSYESFFVDTITINTLISKSSDNDNFNEGLQAYMLFSEYSEYNVLPDNVTFYTITKKRPNYEKLLWLKNDLIKKGITPEVGLYSLLIKRFKKEYIDNNYTSCFDIYRELKKNSIIPEKITYYTLLNKLYKCDEIIEIINDSSIYGMELNDKFINSCFSKFDPEKNKSDKILLRENINNLKSTFENLGYNLPKRSWAIYLGIQNNFEFAKHEFVASMNLGKVLPSSSIFNAILKKDTSNSKSSEIYNLILKHNHLELLSKNTFNLLIKKSENINEAFKYYNHIKESLSSINFDEISFYNISEKISHGKSLNKDKYMDILKVVLGDLKDRTDYIKPRINVFVFLLKWADSRSEEEEFIINTFIELNPLKYDEKEVKDIPNLIAKIKSYDLALKISKFYFDSNYMLPRTVFNSLLKKSAKENNSYPKAKEILLLMEKQNYSLREHQIKWFIGNCFEHEDEEVHYTLAIIRKFFENNFLEKKQFLSFLICLMEVSMNYSLTKELKKIYLKHNIGSFKTRIETRIKREGIVFKFLNNNKLGKDGFLKSHNNQFYFKLSHKYNLTSKIFLETKAYFVIIIELNQSIDSVKIIGV